MLILGLDCAGSACSAAVTEGDATLATCQEIMRRGQAERIVPMMQEVLETAGRSAEALDAIGVTVGPGAFTGVRIGIAAAQGIGRAAGCPVIGVSVTEALAAAVPVAPASTLVVVLDSRRPDPFIEIFRASESGWQGDGPVALSGGLAALPDALGLSDTKGPSGADAQADHLIVAGDLAEQAVATMGAGRVAAVSAYPDPARVAVLAARMLSEGQPAPAVPLYLRAPDVSAPSRDRARRPAGA